MNKFLLLLMMVCGLNVTSIAQPDRWQQHAVYDMDIDFDVETHRFTGTQKLTLTNNSPDELDKVFYHLYFNAFQPGSMMDERNKFLSDSDERVQNRITKLSETEIGYQKIKSLKMDGQAVDFEVVGTILEVSLKNPIQPNSKVTFDMEFEAQVPLQIRRSGRMSTEGIDYSMTQWYPKMCEYDYQGWHANPYVGREFYGIWGDFNVSITIDSRYKIGGTGYLQNVEQIGYGYGGSANKPAKSGKLTWEFDAPNVHDFAWAADPDYDHIEFERKDGIMMHFFYQPGENTTDKWKKLPEVMDDAFNYINKHYGQYPYKQYTFIQGGDGGMEYPMATLITGERNFGSLVGVSVHELMHSWYQMIMGTNEALYAWMDEGFTSYASDEVMNYLRSKGHFGNEEAVANPHIRGYAGFIGFATSGADEPLSVHADHFMTNSAYGVGAYVKGNIFLEQLKYIIGEEAFAKGMLDYYDTWKFKHPNPNDFIRVMEKASGLELDWYREYWVNTTHLPDYGIEKVAKDGKKNTKITMKKIGVMPMPVDVMVTYKDGKKELINIPLRIMRGEKKYNKKDVKYTVAEDWPWTHQTYELVLPVKFKKIQSVEIDEAGRMVDIDRENNKKELGKKKKK